MEPQLAYSHFPLLATSGGSWHCSGTSAAWGRSDVALERGGRRGGSQPKAPPGSGSSGLTPADRFRHRSHMRLCGPSLSKVLPHVMHGLGVVGALGLLGFFAERRRWGGTSGRSGLHDAGGVSRSDSTSVDYALEGRRRHHQRQAQQHAGQDADGDADRRCDGGGTHS